MLFAPYYALKYIWSRKLRSFLTLLGISVGVAAIVSLLSISQGMEDQLMEQVGQLGINNIVYTANGEKKFSDEDIAVLLELEHAVAITPVVTTYGHMPSQFAARAQALSKKRRDIESHLDRIDIVGLDTISSKDVFGYELRKGNYPEKKYESLIGSKVASAIVMSNNKLIDLDKTLYLNDIPLGNGNTKNQVKFKVKGIYKEHGGKAFEFNVDTAVVVNLETIKSITGQSELEYSKFTVKTDDFDNVDILESQINTYFASKGIETSTESAKFYVDQSKESLYVFQVFFAAVGIISLIAGCIGAVNTVLTSVLERTREIGVMKAVGASADYVMALFLIESAILGALGGIVGNGLAFFVSKGLAQILSSTGGVGTANITSDLMIFGFLIGFFASILAGVYPAHQASKLDPIKALRY